MSLTLRHRAFILSLRESASARPTTRPFLNWPLKTLTPVPINLRFLQYRTSNWMRADFLAVAWFLRSNNTRIWMVFIVVSFLVSLMVSFFHSKLNKTEQN